MDSTNNYMNQDDFKRVVQTIPELKIRKWDDTDVKYLFKILYYCALRPIEGIKLSKVDFNINDRYVYLGKTKTESNAKAIIPSIFCTELEIYLHNKDSGRLFPKLTYDTFYRWLKKLGEICEIEAWTTPQNETREKTVGHIFRKSIGKDMVYGNILDKNGRKFEIPIISAHLRHKKPSITIDHYLKASQEQVRTSW